MRKLFGWITIVLLGFSLTGSVLLLAPHMHHEGGCPFMPHENEPCMMDFQDHVAAWQRMTTATTTDIAWLLVGAAMVALVLPLVASPTDQLRIHNGGIREPVPRSLYEVLLARGIMHGKNP